MVAPLRKEERLRRLELLEKQLLPEKRNSAKDSQAQEATKDVVTWATQYTETYNEHWAEEGRPSPYEKLPPYAYFQDLFDPINIGRKAMWNREGSCYSNSPAFFLPDRFDSIAVVLLSRLLFGPNTAGNSVLFGISYAGELRGECESGIQRTRSTCTHWERT